MKLQFSQQISEKYSNITFHENPSSEAELFHADRQTDRHNEANSRFSQFCERASKWFTQNVNDINIQLGVVSVTATTSISLGRYSQKWTQAASLLRFIDQHN